MFEDCAPLILTLKLNAYAFAALDRLRQQYFPPARNFLSAHVTLFHALPGDQTAFIKQTLKIISAETCCLHLAFPRLRFLGAGVAVEIESPELVNLRQRLAKIWDVWLGKQDQQGYRPHVTIQNKVAPDDARKLYESLAATWDTAFAGRGEGLLLWRYLRCPWELMDEFAFNAPLNSAAARH